MRTKPATYYAMVNGPPQKLTVERVAGVFSGRYRIESELGVGGMATVFVAEDVKMGRRVAVKVLQPELGASVGVDRFLRETEIAAGLNHPHIVPVLDRGEAGGFIYYVMSLIEGETVRDTLNRRGQLGVDETVRLLRDVIDALEYAHKLELVHRDIKPENVLISGRHALVMDFGVAKALSLPPDSQQLTTMGAAVGTPRYMSPEQAVGDEEVDQRSDIYAVGVLAYELLTGAPPFTGSPRQVLMAHVTQDPVQLTEVSESVPASLANIVMRCLAKEPEDRYQTSQELLDEVEALSMSGTRVAQAVRRTPVGIPKIGRWAVAAAVVAAVALGAAAFGGGNGESTTPVTTNRIMVLPFENRTGDASLDEAGVVAAEFITQGLQREEIGSAVPAASVVRILNGLGADVQDPAAALAESAGAEIVVSGSIRRQGDQVILTPDVVEARTGNVISVTEPVRASSVSDAVAVAAQRIQGMLALHLNFRNSVFRMSPPPNMEVYRELLTGREAMYRGDFERAAVHFDRVSEIAPTYRSHAALSAATRVWTGDYATADSLLTSALASPGRLTSTEILNLENVLAHVRGDLEEEYRTAVEMAERDPTRVNAHALAAIRTNRPREVIAALTGLDPESPTSSGALFHYPPQAHHLLGEFDESLLAARRAQELLPTDLGVLNLAVQAAAALGDFELVDSLLSETTGKTAPFEGPPMDTPGWSTLLAGLELGAHGHEDEGSAMLARAASWYEAQSARRPNDAALDFASAMAVYYSGDFSRAVTLFRTLSESDPDNIDYLGFLGVALARGGQPREASAVDARLAAIDRAYHFGQQTRWRARIAALSGNVELSVSLLREAFSEGIGLGFGQLWDWLHIDPDLAPLRGLEEFETFRAPRI